MFLKESPSGAGGGALDRFLAAVFVSPVLESQIVVVCSCYSGCLTFTGGSKETIKYFLFGNEC